MKKLLYSFFLCLVFAGSLKAAAINHPGLPNVNQHISEAVYQSAFTTVSGSYTVCAFASSLYALVVSSVGSADASVEIFDSNVTTQTVPSLLGIMDVGTNSKSLPPIPFRIDCTSGITVNVLGTIPPKLGYIYRRR